MKQQIEMVREFMKSAGQEMPEKPILLTGNRLKLRCDLITEENSELCASPSVTEELDAVTDLLYVVLGSALACGFSNEQILAAFTEVHRSNMSKFIDGHRREDGKWIKGPSYSPANLGPILEGA